MLKSNGEFLFNGGTIKMNIHEELKKELKAKLFKILAITACAANAIGFMICFLLNNVSQPTIMCGVCCLILLALGVFGIVTKNINIASVGIIIIAGFIELPILHYIYGPTTSAYLILAVVCIALFLPKGTQLIMFGIVFIIDVACIIASYIKPSKLGEVSADTQMMTMIWSYIIVAIAMFTLVQIITQQYVRQRAELLKMTEELEIVAHHDQLTGLYNRRYMMDTLEKWMPMLDKDFVVVYIDLDDFKNINDSYGFVFGDTVLVEFAKILQENIKDVGFASRYGGQEFVAMIDKANKDEVLAIIDKIREEYNDFSAKAKNAKFTFSAGVLVDDKTLDLDEILATADDKLHQAKRAGKNQVII